MEVKEASFGAALEAALVEAVFAAKARDSLAPVTVVVPSLLAGVAARRAIAGRRPVAFVTTMTPTQLARSVLVASGELRSPMNSSVERELVRQALEPWAARFGAIDGQLGDGVVEAVIGALRALGSGEVGITGTGGPGGHGGRDDGRCAALLAVRDELDRSAGEFLPAAAVAPLAARAVADAGRGAIAEALGAVVLYGVEPESLAGGETALIAALDRVVPITVVRGLDDGVDLGAPKIVVAPDPEVEVADAVSFLLAEAERGVPLHSMAIVATAPDPWLTLAHQRLAASGIPFNGRRSDRLSTTPAARFLLGALRLDRRLERDAVVAWWASAPIVWEGRAVAPDRWAMLARLAGVVRGSRQWRDRLDQLAWAFEHPRARRGGADDDVSTTAHWPWPTALDDVRAVREAVEATDAMVRDRGARPWSEHVTAAMGVLGRFLGAPSFEVDGLVVVRAALEELAALDHLSPKPISHSVFVSALVGALDRPAGRVGTFGDGVFTGTLEETAGLAFTVVAMVGLTDERLPSPSGEPPLIGELDANGAPERRARREARDRRRLAALLAAPTCRLSFARTDPYAGRECLPSPWLLEVAAVVAGRPFSGEALAHVGASEAPSGIRSIESFASFLSKTSDRTPIDRSDVELAEIASATVAGVVDIEGHPYLAHERRRRRAIEAARSRAAAGFSEWDGAVGPTGVDGLELVQRSPSGLEAYAACPRRYFYERVLDLTEVDDPIEERTVSARERGLLVHAALEALVEAEGDAAATGHDRWSDAARAAAHEALDRACDDLERRGRTGTGLPWRLERRTLHLELDRTIAHDDRLRVEERFLPVAAEVQFGFDRPPATIDLVDGRRMEFHGFIDRVDASGDGRRVLVTDYKTGRPPTVKEMREERRRGRRLQLPIYALAARDLRPDADAVEARYWYVSSRGNWEERAVQLDDDTLDDLSRAVSIVVDGIEAGRFPARPGERDRDSYVNCRYCPFDRLCAADRDREWERVRSAPGLQAYARLAEGDLDAG
ncbi:MAG: PD-(D/E)XK nuclease family protein [Acidimicrobiia bacterium]